MKRAVVCLNDDVHFISCTEAARFYDVPLWAVFQVCAGKLAHIKGLVFMDMDVFNKSAKKDTIIRKAKKYKVEQRPYWRDLKVINLCDGEIYNSVVCAAKFYNVSGGYVLDVCEKKKKAADGLNFRFYERLASK